MAKKKKKGKGGGYRFDFWLSNFMRDYVATVDHWERKEKEGDTDAQGIPNQELDPRH